jgi:hypothetical protein
MGVFMIPVPHLLVCQSPAANACTSKANHTTEPAMQIEGVSCASRLNRDGLVRMVQHMTLTSKACRGSFSPGGTPVMSPTPPFDP